MITNYEIFDLLNRMDRANDFLKNKGDIEELLENLTLVQNYLARYESLGSLIKDLKKIEDLIYVTKELFTIEDAAKYMGVSVHHIYKLTSNHEISVYKPSGKLIYISRKELHKWMTKNLILSDDEIREMAKEQLGKLIDKKMNKKQK